MVLAPFVPVRYACRPGGTVCARRTRRRRYVCAEGPLVAVDPVDPVDPEEREALALRCLPPDRAAAYLKSTQDQLTHDVVLRMRPRSW